MSAIAPITGRFKARLYRDLAGSLTVGTVLACAFYYGHSKPKLEKFRAFDAANKERILAEEAQWMTENNYSRQ
jgi:hypothetical protein